MNFKNQKIHSQILINTILVILVSITILSFKTQKQDVFKAKKVFKSKELIITQVAENSFVHTSYLQTDEFGNVPCNGLIVRSDNETIVFDTPTNNKSADKLIKWIKEELDCKINAIIPTHFHDDCLGGLNSFHRNNIPSFAYFKTIELAKENKFEIPINSIKDSIELRLGSKKIVAKFFGEGHTIDNIVGYYPSDNILFGGCLIKELEASKGNLRDANIADWSNTVEKIKKEFPNLKIIVPGHGRYGNTKLLDYTINLFKTK